MKIERQSRMLVRAGEIEAGVGAGLLPSTKAKNVIAATPADSCVLRSKARSASEVPKVPMKDYCSVRRAAFNKFEDLYELETGCHLSGKMGVSLADHPYSTHSERGKAVCSKSGLEEQKPERCEFHAKCGRFWSVRPHLCSDLVLLH